MVVGPADAERQGAPVAGPGGVDGRQLGAEREDEVAVDPAAGGHDRDRPGQADRATPARRRAGSLALDDPQDGRREADRIVVMGMAGVDDVVEDEPRGRRRPPAASAA